MNPDDFNQTKTDLEAFAGEVFASFSRAEHRRRGVMYLRGLMLDGRRGSKQTTGERGALTV